MRATAPCTPNRERAPFVTGGITARPHRRCQRSNPRTWAYTDLWVSCGRRPDPRIPARPCEPSEFARIRPLISCYRRGVPEFSHLHLHTQYSLLDGAIRLEDLFPQVLARGMKSVAITDHGNLFGALDFYETAKKHGVKPIFACETYIAPDRHDRTERKSNHLILLAKNNVGWKNLSYLNSMGF